MRTVPAGMDLFSRWWADVFQRQQIGTSCINWSVPVPTWCCLVWENRSQGWSKQSQPMFSTEEAGFAGKFDSCAAELPLNHKKMTASEFLVGRGQHLAPSCFTTCWYASIVECPTCPGSHKHTVSTGFSKYYYFRYRFWRVPPGQNAAVFHCIHQRIT